jgi:hypothetical protein
LRTLALPLGHIAIFIGFITISDLIDYVNKFYVSKKTSYLIFNSLAGAEGLDPSTNGFGDRSSTN